MPLPLPPTRHATSGQNQQWHHLATTTVPPASAALPPLLPSARVVRRCSRARNCDTGAQFAIGLEAQPGGNSCSAREPPSPALLVAMATTPSGRTDARPQSRRPHAVPPLGAGGGGGGRGAAAHTSPTAESAYPPHDGRRAVAAVVAPPYICPALRRQCWPFHLRLEAVAAAAATVRDPHSLDSQPPRPRCPQIGGITGRNMEPRRLTTRCG